MYTITFSKKVNNQNVPFTIDGVEAQIRVDADNKSSAIFHEETKQFCTTNGCTVRSVSNG